MEQNNMAQTALDQMVSNDQTQMIKAAVPYLPPAGQRILSVYAKIQELANTAALFSPENGNMRICAAEVTDPLEMLQDIRNYSFGKSRREIDQITNMLALVQMIQIMNE